MNEAIAKDLLEILKWLDYEDTKTEGGAYILTRGRLKRAAEAALAAASVSSAKQITVSCVQCGKAVDTRETEDGGSSDGCEVRPGRWICSHDCWEKEVPDDFEKVTLT